MVGYHPLLFTLIALLAAAELGLSAFWVHMVQHEPSDRFRSLIILFLFNSVWTLLFAGAYVFWISEGALHVFASIGSSGLWLVITAVLWGVAAGLIDSFVGGPRACTGTPSISSCRELQTLEAIGWTEMSLCILALLAALFWVQTSRRSYRGSYYV